MALTPNDILRISEPVEQMYMDCTSQLLINLSKHLPSNSPTAMYEAEKLAEMGQLTKESIEIIAANTNSAPILVEWAITDGMGLELQEVEKVCQGAAAKGKIQSATTSWQASERVKNVVSNLVDQAVNDTNIVNTVMLDSTRQRYAQAVQYVAEEEARILATYGAMNVAELESKLQLTQGVLNQATLSTAIGAEARTQAVRKAVEMVVAQGITGYIDAGGHKWSPEAYINMDIRTTVHNAAVQGQKARSADYDVQTFQISSHAGARPLCAPYQGKIYSWDGSTGVVTDLYGVQYHYEGIGNTSYGQPAGIFGINCGHRPVTFVDGYSKPRFEPTEDEEENKKQYELSQKQRYLERQIRDEKTKALCYDAAGDKEAFKKSAERIKEKTAKYKDFCKANNLTQRPSNTQVYGYNKSIASKVNAVKVAPKNLTPMTVTATTTPKPISTPITTDEAGAMRGVPRLSKMTATEAAQGVNPLYGTEGIAYKENCANCAVAEELRIRGYDVQAGAYNSKTKVSYFWGGGDKGNGSWTDSFNEKTPATYIFATRKDQQAEKIQKTMDAWGENSRAVVFVQWDGRKIGHYFTAVNENGKVKFINPQDPSSDAEKFFDYCRPTATCLFRTDDKTISDFARNVVTWNGK